MRLYLLESGKTLSFSFPFPTPLIEMIFFYRSCFGHPGTYYNWMDVLAIIMCFIFCVFAGVEPTLKQVNQYPVVNWPWYLSFATWTAESTFYTWSYYLKDYDKVDISLQDAADHYDYNISHGLNRSIGGLLALGIAMRIIAIFFLWYKTK